jgi:hypothetical protein
VPRALLLALLTIATGCAAPAAPHQPQTRIVGWKKLADWRGHGNLQTETFLSDNGTFRLHWEAANESPPGKGTLKVAFRSGDSGRVIIDAVDHKGAGDDTLVVGDQVRWYYLTIDSANLDWLVAVEEPIMGHSARKTDP